MYERPSQTLLCWIEAEEAALLGLDKVREISELVANIVDNNT